MIQTKPLRTRRAKVANFVVENSKNEFGEYKNLLRLDDICDELECPAEALRRMTSGGTYSPLAYHILKHYGLYLMATEYKRDSGRRGIESVKIVAIGSVYDFFELKKSREMYQEKARRYIKGVVEKLNFGSRALAVVSSLDDQMLADICVSEEQVANIELKDVTFEQFLSCTHQRQLADKEEKIVELEEENANLREMAGLEKRLKEKQLEEVIEYEKDQPSLSDLKKQNDAIYEATV